MKMKNIAEWILFSQKKMVPNLSFDLLRNYEMHKNTNILFRCIIKTVKHFNPLVLQ